MFCLNVCSTINNHWLLSVVIGSYYNIIIRIIIIVNQLKKIKKVGIPFTYIQYNKLLLYTYITYKIYTN